MLFFGAGGNTNNNDIFGQFNNKLAITHTFAIRLKEIRCNDSRLLL